MYVFDLWSERANTFFCKGNAILDPSSSQSCSVNDIESRRDLGSGCVCLIMTLSQDLFLNRIRHQARENHLKIIYNTATISPWRKSLTYPTSKSFRFLSAKRLHTQMFTNSSFFVTSSVRWSFQTGSLGRTTKKSMGSGWEQLRLISASALREEETSGTQGNIYVAFERIKNNLDLPSIIPGSSEYNAAIRTLLSHFRDDPVPWSRGYTWQAETTFVFLIPRSAMKTGAVTTLARFTLAVSFVPGQASPLRAELSWVSRFPEVLSGSCLLWGRLWDSFGGWSLWSLSERPNELYVHTVGKVMVMPREHRLIFTLPRDTAKMRYSAVRPPRFWVSGYCTKWRIQGQFW